MAAAGLQVTHVSANRLLVKVTGKVGALNRCFGTVVHNYQNNGRNYHGPAFTPKIPDAIGPSVLAVCGLSSAPVFKPHLARTPAMTPLAGPAQPATVNGNAATGIPGQLLVGDVAQMYQVNPIYKVGLKGQGHALGIATFANFDPSDAYEYWKEIGLAVSPTRIITVLVNSPGDITYDGDIETTLDVEQSGGLAPQADVIVYVAPNTDLAFLDLFTQVVEENKVQTLSISWGWPEIFGGCTEGQMLAENQLFMQAAAQGISLFAATGDGGAYTVNLGIFPYGFCSLTLTVSDPASSPFMTAAGGLTIAASFPFGDSTVTIPCDRAWAWDYFQKLVNQDDYFNNFFPLGGGGAVSVFWGVPAYQAHLPGIEKSAKDQSFIYYPNGSFDPTGAQDWVDLPKNFNGRNVPDISLNGDPFTGYAVYYQGSWQYGWGGTSFVAPQLNGIASLLSQMVGTRLGLLNPVLYRIARDHGYDQKLPVFNDITAGNNLFYRGQHGYDPASGLGSVNAFNLGLRLLQGEPDND